MVSSSVLQILSPYMQKEKKYAAGNAQARFENLASSSCGHIPAVKNLPPRVINYIGLVILNYDQTLFVAH